VWYCNGVESCCSLGSVRETLHSATSKLYILVKLSFGNPHTHHVLVSALLRVIDESEEQLGNSNGKTRLGYENTPLQRCKLYLAATFPLRDRLQKSVTGWLHTSSHIKCVQVLVLCILQYGPFYHKYRTMA
jgi:hypothetical protein